MKSRTKNNRQHNSKIMECEKRIIIIWNIILTKNKTRVFELRIHLICAYEFIKCKTGYGS